MMGSTSHVPTSNVLLTFDSTRLLRHISPNDDKAMVDYVVLRYGDALNSAMRYYNADIATNMKMYYEDAYYTAAVDEDEYNNNHAGSKQPSFFRRTVSESGLIIAKKARYDELVELCIDTFNSEIAAYLRSIQLDQARQIFTVRVLGYENRILKLLVTTDLPFIP